MGFQLPAEWEDALLLESELQAPPRELEGAELLPGL